MLRCLMLLALAVVGTWRYGHVAAAIDPCGIGGLEVIYMAETYPCGNEVKLATFSNEPPQKVTLTETAEDSEYYTLFMVDPDAPSRVPHTYWLHWLVMNIPKDDFKQGYHGGADKKVGNPLVLKEYKPPNPPRGGPHHYQFLAFKQPREFSDSELVAPDQRGDFNLHTFSSKYKLEGPVAGYEIITRKN